MSTTGFQRSTRSCKWSFAAFRSGNSRHTVDRSPAVLWRGQTSWLLAGHIVRWARAAPDNALACVTQLSATAGDCQARPYSWPDSAPDPWLTMTNSVASSSRWNVPTTDAGPSRCAPKWARGDRKSMAGRCPQGPARAPDVGHVQRQNIRQTRGIHQFLDPGGSQTMHARGKRLPGSSGRCTRGEPTRSP